MILQRVMKTIIGFLLSGERNFGLETQHVIRIRLVPITVGGRTVELNSQLVRQFKDYMIGMFPNHDMDVEVRSSLILPSSNSQMFLTLIVGALL